MDDTLKIILLVLAMAGVTYLLRVLPFAFFTKKITSPYIKSVMYYLPFAVLSAMTFPFVFYSTGNFYAALIGTAAAITLATFKQSLIVVAICACAVTLIFSFIV